LHTGFVLLATGVAVLPLLVAVVAVLLQPASSPADRTHAAVSPPHHLAIMHGSMLGDRGRRITRIG
jgi:hypothetical protein